MKKQINNLTKLVGGMHTPHTPPRSATGTHPCCTTISALCLYLSDHQVTAGFFY